MTGRPGTLLVAGLGVLILSLGTGGCGGRKSIEVGEPMRIGTQGPSMVRGLVRQVGNVPFERTVIRRPDPVEDEVRTVVVTGPMEPEIRALIGAEVRVWGRRAEAPVPFGRAIEATGYEILSVDGDVPVAGILRHGEEGWWIEGPEGGVLPLSAVPPALAEAADGRIWVVPGEENVVLRFGVLRAPEARSPDGPTRDPGR